MSGKLSTVAILEVAFDAIDHVDEVETFVDRIKSIAEKQGSNDIIKRAKNIGEIIQSKNSSVVHTALSIGEIVLGQLGDLAPPPFDSMVGLMSKLCGLSLKVEANREAAVNLANRLLALRPAVLELARRDVNSKDKAVKEIIRALEAAFELLSKCVPPPPDPNDGFFKNFLNFGKKIISQVTTSAEEFAEIHIIIDRALKTYEFTAIVNFTAPSKKQLEEWVESDAAILKQEMEDVIRKAISEGNEVVKAEMLKFQNDLHVSSQALMKKTDELSTQMRMLLRKEDYAALRVDEDRVVILSEDPVGAGGNAVVAKATLDGGTVIVAKCSKKPIGKRIVGNREQEAAAAQAAKDEARDILDEARLLLRIPHPNIIRCFGVAVKKQKTYLLLEQCHLNLSEALERATRESRLPNDIAAIILLKTAASLSALHHSGQVHRDIKSQNVMFRDDGELFLIDLGSAKAEVKNAMSTTQTMGSNMNAAGTTLIFAAPEILATHVGEGTGEKLRATKKCDVYSFGMLMYHVLTSSAPFGNANPYEILPKIVRDKHRPELPAGSFPDQLVSLMKECWRHDPDRRPRIDQVRDRLARYLSEISGDEEDTTIVWLERWKQFYQENIKEAETQSQVMRMQSMGAIEKDTSRIAVCEPEEIIPNIAMWVSAEKLLEDGPTMSEIVEAVKNSLGIPTATLELLRSIPRSQKDDISLTHVCAFVVSCLKELHRDVTERAQGLTTGEYLINAMNRLPPFAKERLAHTPGIFDDQDSDRGSMRWVEFCVLIDKIYSASKPTSSSSSARRLSEKIPESRAAVVGAAPEATQDDDGTPPHEHLLVNVESMYRSAVLGNTGGLLLHDAVKLVKSMGFKDVNESEIRRREVRRGRPNGSRSKDQPATVTLSAFHDFVLVVLEDIFSDAPIDKLSDHAAVLQYVKTLVDLPTTTLPASNNIVFSVPIQFSAFAKCVDAAFAPLIADKSPATVPSVPAAAAAAEKTQPQQPRSAPSHAVATFQDPKVPTGTLRNVESRHTDKGCTVVLNGVELASLVGLETDVSCAAFHPDGKRIATGTDNLAAPIKIWSVETGKALMTLKGHKDVVSALAYNAAGTLIASGSADKTAKVYNLTTGKAVCTLHGHTSDVNCVVFSPDASFVVTGSDDTTANVYDVSNGSLICSLVGHAFWVRAAAVSHDGSKVATGSSDKTVKLWNPQNAKMLLSIDVGASVESIEFSADDSLIRVATEDKSRKVWSVENGSFVRQA